MQGGDLDTLASQVFTQQAAQVQVVVDEKDSSGHGIPIQAKDRLLAQIAG
jgi:hypothetical protein